MNPSSEAFPQSSSAQAAPSRGRIESLDQFRGYSVVGMMFVNFLGGLAVIPAVLDHHNTYCSYADIIMPHFFFAMGFAFQLTFVRRLERNGWSAAASHALKRNLGLIVVGIVVYGLDGQYKSWSELKELGVLGFVQTAFQRSPFQALTHIGVTALWVLPVMGRSWTARLVWTAASVLLHIGLSRWFYYDWVMKRPGIDGGPLGFLTWTVPLLVGSMACDLMTKRGPRRAIGPMIGWGVGLMALGYGLSCLNGGWAAWPFTPPEGPGQFWTMSQRAGSASYLIFAAGASLPVYALFVAACDLGGWRLGLLDLLGRNALVAYVVHLLAMRTLKPYLPEDAPLLYVLGMFVLLVTLVAFFARQFDPGRTQTVSGK